MTVWSQVGYSVGTGAGGEGGVITVEVEVVDVGEMRSGIELDAEEDATESNDGVDVADVVEAFVEVADCVVVEVGVVLETDSDADVVVDVATTGVDEGVEVLDEDNCVRSLGVEEDSVLEVESDVVDEAVTSDDVEVVASDETVDVTDDDESVVCAEEKWTNEKPNTANNTIPPTIPIRNEVCFIDLLVIS